MNSRKIIIVSLALGVLLVLGIFGAGMVIAQDGNKYPPVVQKLAEKFNLDVDEVKEVFDEAREERHQEMRARFEERLDKAVEKGKITEEQKEAILEKKDELKKKHKELKDLSPKERRKALKELREEIKKWAEENDIDLKLFFGHGPKRHHHPRFGPPPPW